VNARHLWDGQCGTAGSERLGGMHPTSNGGTEEPTKLEAGALDALQLRHGRGGLAGDTAAGTGAS
jgi:hypothetical protein